MYSRICKDIVIKKLATGWRPSTSKGPHVHFQSANEEDEEDGELSGKMGESRI